MRRPGSIITIVASILLATAAIAPGVAAQDDAVATADHPFVGSWILEPQADEPPELMTIAPGGIVTQAGPDGTGYGSWAPTGERTADLTFLLPFVDPEAGFLGFATFRGSVEVSEDGQSIGGTYTVQASPGLAEAMGLPVGELGPDSVTGKRIGVEPMGETVGPMPPMPQVLDITLADYSVAISPDTVKVGQPIAFAVTNAGAETHEMVLEKAGDADVPLEADGVESEIEDILAGTTAELVWTITEPGTYQLACHIPGHYEQGMVMTFEVVE